MSIIFGIRKPSSAIATRHEVLTAACATARYALDGASVAVQGRIGMGFQPYHTHERSNLEAQPLADSHGNMLSLDGRIDNHLELRNALNITKRDASDSFVVLAAFLRWGEGCFSKLIGDWALALWSATEQTVYLARDHAGTRTLYFQNNGDGSLQWSTHLETFCAGDSAHSLDERYVACYLSSQPTRDLTSYKNIESVPPAHYLAIRGSCITRSAHWEWVTQEKIRYQSDADYEEAFLSLFKQSVERRTGPGAPILAQLSGGMDSTSIVSMSDYIHRSERQSTDLLDTISFYNDSEPNWDEQPYFSAVEATRGKLGIHVNAASKIHSFEPPIFAECQALTPGLHSASLQNERNFNSLLDGKGYRVILSGIGGDEVLGGVPTPTPELADYLASGNIFLLLKRTTEWSLANRVPFLQTLAETIKTTRELYQNQNIDWDGIPPWIAPRLLSLISDLSHNALGRPSPQGVSPTAICNGLAWWSVLDSLPHMTPNLLVRYEYRFPYLDRDLVNFLFRIPREQIVRPGRRRSLMRRALKNIVPVKVLERRRKAYCIRKPLLSIQEGQDRIRKLFDNSRAVELGFVDRAELGRALELTVEGRDIRWLNPLRRVISFELWLLSRDQVSSSSSTDARESQTLLL